MIKLAIIIIEHIKLFLHPVIINAFVFYQNNKRIKHENWGDDINYYFLREIIKSPVVLFNRTSLAFRLKLRNYLVLICYVHKTPKYGELVLLMEVNL